MCGIVGAVSPRGVPVDLIDAARDRLAHRGPDAAGTWAGEFAALGHRRLSIIDLSAEADQPFASDDGRFVLTFNGEIYNHRQLRRELEQRGRRFHTTSDTEVLLHAFAEWREACLPKLSGMFAFAIWDCEERSLFCARDRVGEKPFYYASLGDTFVFASELKALCDWPGFRREIDYSAIVDFLTLGFVAEPKTAFVHGATLPAGQWMRVHVDEGRHRLDGPHVWWDLEFAPDRDERDWESAIRAALGRAADEMTFADVPLGVFLSGGVDSSCVVAAAAGHGHAIRTFTIGFAEAGYDERPYAARVATVLGTGHTERLVDIEDVEAVRETLLWHFDEPFGDYASIPMYELCRATRRDITVALSGDGADELFGGYRKYARLALRERLSHPLARASVSAGSRVAGALGLRGRISDRLRVHAGDATTMLTDTLVTGFPPAMLRHAARGPLLEVASMYGPADVVAPLLERAAPADVGLLNAMRYLDVKLTLNGDMLVKLDRASMAVALEVRPVFLHRDVIDVARRIPPELLASRREPKRLLKATARGWLPSDIIDRPKHGFALPLPVWLRMDGAEAVGVHELHATRDLLDLQFVENAVTEHRNTSLDATAVLYRVGLLERWLDMWG
jgi:asparagine synthase (glutamine-hydrolysing)